MIGWLAVFFLMGAAGTWLARRYALQRDLVDEPGERRSHAVRTPRGGGIAIVAVLLVACIALALREPLHAPWLTALGVGIAMVAGVGWVDDHRPLSPWLRLAFLPPKWRVLLAKAALFVLPGLCQKTPSDASPSPNRPMAASTSRRTASW